MRYSRNEPAPGGTIQRLGARKVNEKSRGKVESAELDGVEEAMTRVQSRDQSHSRDDAQKVRICLANPDLLGIIS